VRRALLVLALAIGACERDYVPDNIARPLGDLELPAVTMTGYAPITEPAPAIIATPAVLRVGDRTLVKLEHGDIDCAEKEGGCNGSRIVKLETYLHGVLDDRKANQLPDAPVRILVDRSLGYRVFLEILTSTRKLARRYDIVGEAGGMLVATPFAIPEGPRSPPVTPGAGPPIYVVDRGFGLFVTILRDQMVVWSTSGREGTLSHPVATIARADRVEMVELGRVLVEIAQRHRDEHAVVLQADGKVPMQRIAEALGVLHASAFANVTLSSGFE
jgi:hypothetical protein